jgi:hypothetical protein
MLTDVVSGYNIINAKMWNDYVKNILSTLVNEYDFRLPAVSSYRIFTHMCLRKIASLEEMCQDWKQYVKITIKIVLLKCIPYV